LKEHDKDHHDDSGSKSKRALAAESLFTRSLKEHDKDHHDDSGSKSKRALNLRGEIEEPVAVVEDVVEEIVESVEVEESI